MVQFLNDVSFLFCRFLKSGVTNELKSIFLLKGKKNQGYLFKTGQNFAAPKTLVWSAYVRTAIATFFFKKRVIYELGSHFNQAFLVRKTHFLSVETTIIYLFFKYYPLETGWNKDIFKRRVMYKLRGLFI